MEDAMPENRLDAPADYTEEAHPTRVSYTLRYTSLPALGQLVAVAVAAAVYTVLSWLSIPIPSGIPLVSALFIAIGFGIPFALWFGGWAFVIAYLGNFLGAGLLSPQPLPLPVALWFGTVDLIQLGLPMILYRLLAPRFGVSSIGKDVLTVRDFIVYGPSSLLRIGPRPPQIRVRATIFFVLCAVLPNNILGGLYGNFILVATGTAPANTLLPGWLVWSLSNIVVTIIIGPILLRALGPVVERSGLTIRNLLN